MKPVAIAALLIGALWLNSRCYAGPSSPIEKKEKPTTLRVLGSPTGTFRSSSDGIFITEVKAEVKNVGTVMATKISVTGTLPGGEVVTLNGPGELGPNKGALYSISLYRAVTSNKNVSAKATCANCRH